MAAEDYLLSILAVFKDSATGELKKFGQSVLGAGNASEKAGKKTAGFGDKLTTLSAKFVSLRTGAQQAGEMFQKAFDFAELGAQSLQTADSFEILLEKVEASPDLLDELRSASRNTISDMKLMSATSTLLAGAQGDLATALAGSTPKLMEIAKAANAINPSLGDTAFLYESLATGIKRASPMILDNLGLTIKIGEANERFAQSLGKSVDQLTAEEQKMALLNETIRAGGVLIEQAGDNIDSATDDFARFETAIENAKIGLAEMAVPIFGPLLEQLTDLFIITEKELAAIARSEDAAARRAKTREEYAEIVREEMILETMALGVTREAAETTFAVMRNGNIAVLGFAAQTIRKDREYIAIQIEKAKAVGKSTKELEKRYDELSDKLERNRDETIELDWATTELGAAQREQTEALHAQVQTYHDVEQIIGIGIGSIQDARRATREQRDSIDELQVSGYGLARSMAEVVSEERRLEIAAWDAANAQAELAGKMSDLETQMRGAVGDELENYAEKQSGLAEKARELKDKIEDLKAGEDWPSDEAVDQLGEWRDELTEVEDTIQSTADAHKEAMRSIIFDLMMARLNVDGLTEAEAELAIVTAHGMGLIDDDTAAAMAGVNESIAQFDKDGKLADAALRAIELADAMDGIAGAGQGVAGAAAPAIGLAENWEMLAQQQIGAAFTETTGAVEETAGTVTEEIDLLHDKVIGLTEERYEMDIAIKDRDLFLESLASAESMVKFLSGTHTVSLRLQTSGALPGAAAPPAAAAVGGGPIPRFQTGGIVEETGLAFVHAGELIIPPIEAQQMREGGGGTTITEGDVNNFNLNVTSVQELSSIMQEFAVMQAMAG